MADLKVRVVPQFPAHIIGGTGIDVETVGDTVTVSATGSGIADGDYGDITVSGGGAVLTIDTGVVTYAKIQDVSATSRVLGRITSGSGDVEELTGTNIRTISGLTTSDSPQFTGIELGNVSDTTITRAAAGSIAVEGSTVAMLGTEDQILAGGARVTSKSLSTGTITPDPGDRPLQYVTNGGAFTINAPTNDGSLMLLVTNNGSAGAITFTGFTVGSNTGDALTTTNTHKFTISIWRINSVSGYRIAAHQ